MKKWLLIGLCILSSMPAQASLQEEINQIVAQNKGRAKIGIAVQSLNTGAMLYQKDANQLLVPASNMKVFTAYAALSQLGSDFTYKTQALTDGTLQKGVLKGNLYVRFDGDPSLKTEDLNQLFADLKAQGLRTVTGNLIIDDARYDNAGVAPGTLQSDTRYCYGAPVGTANLNRNCIPIKIVAAKRAGQKAQVVFPGGVPLPLENRVITQAGAKNVCGISFKTVSDSSRPILSGCIKLKSPPKALQVALPETRQYGRSAVVSLLKKQGIRIQGDTLAQPAKSNVTILATHHSKPMSALVFQMLRRSDNLIANALFKKVGASYFKQPGTWDHGSRAVRSLLAANRSVNTSQMAIVDGSGLSRFNQVTAIQLVQVLRQAWNADPSVADNFVDGLPISGDPGGTLRRRMGDAEMRGRVKAKTGTMNGVVSLAGYVETRNKQILAFSIIVNAPGGSSAQYRMLADKICRVLARG